MTSLAISGYDAGKDMYTEERFDSKGRHVIVTGALKGGTLTWMGENNYGGRTIQLRVTIKMIPPTSYTSKYEISADGGTTWMPFREGKATKK